MSIPKAVHDEFSDAIQAGDGDVVEAVLRRYPGLIDNPCWVPPPLHCAVLWDRPKIADILLNSGANIELTDPDRNTTPLRYAIVFCKAQMVSLLVSRGANTGPIMEGGSTAMQLAKGAAAGEFEEYEDMPPRSKYVQIVDLLQQLGAE